MAHGHRDAQLTSTYRALAEQLRTKLQRKLNIDANLVDDGLAFAWTRAYELEDVDLTDQHRLGGWIYVVALRRALELHRRHTDPRLTSLPLELAEQAPSLEDRLIAREDLREMTAAVTDRQLEVLGLAAAGYSTPEIEQITGQSYRTVRRLLDEGRARGRAARESG